MSTQKDLCLFTSEFPYGSYESFIENEITILSKNFNNIYIFPMIGFDQNIRELPSNVKVINLDTSKRAKSVIFKDAILFASLSRKINKIPEFTFNEKREWINRIIHLLNIKHEFETWHQQQNSTDFIYYSYWFSDWAHILSMLKKQGKIPRFISRAHGFDVYSEVNHKNIMPLQKLLMDQVHKTYVVSKYGAQYLKRKYSKVSSKVEYSPLGTQDYSFKNHAENEVFTVLSCSTINQTKRIHLIIEALKHVKVPIKWIHFGDGPLKKEILYQSQELKDNIIVEFKGRIKNSELMEYYKAHKVDVLLNVSESEGLPVSIMEAISFGIPIIATDVGGTNEIVNKDTGILLEKNFNPKDLAVHIANSVVNSILPPQKSVRNFWDQNYRASKNYEDFTNSILK